MTRQDWETLVNDGLTIAAIAEQLGCSTLTVRRWLGRHGLKTRASRRIDSQRMAALADSEVIVMACEVHGDTSFVRDRSGRYRCRRCRVDAVTRRRRKVKEILVAEAGGACAICGYRRYIGALEFHHVNPEEKRLGLAMGGITLAISTLREEASKCVLLCSNCHAEVEAGLATLPIHLV